MIQKREIIDAASALGLNPHVVEKDYVLGWLLWGIFSHEELTEKWVFKGGTCLKKCFFETYRFSEDLDFTLTDATHISSDFLSRIFAEIGQRIYDKIGIEFPSGSQGFDVYRINGGRERCQGKIGYQGPISPTGRSMPRIKLDLLADECLALPPVRPHLFHPYTDSPGDGIVVQSYDYAEVFAEKIRALGERARPRDLYDVISFFRNDALRPAASVVLDVLCRKCEFKGIELPSLEDLSRHKDSLNSSWNSMLAHQLPALPPVDSFWAELPSFFQWLKGTVSGQPLAAYVGAVGEHPIRTRALDIPVAPAIHSYLEIIRFAATNRLCVNLDYLGSSRRIEPYSLRRTRQGNIVLHAHNIDKNEHRSYRVDRIQGAHVTNVTFSPRFEIELTPAGPLPVPPTRQHYAVAQT